MRKIGIAALTLLAISTAACAESPVGIHAESMRPTLNGEYVEWGSYEEGGPDAGDPGEAAIAGEEATVTTQEAARNPGLGLSGN
jgi:hypothetical protein